MNEKLTPRRIIALIMIVIGLVLYFDGMEVQASAENTISYIMSPATKILDNPESLSNFDAETYLNTSVSKTVEFSIDMFKYFSEVEVGIGAIILGAILLFVRTMEWEREFYKKTASFFLP